MSPRLTRALVGLHGAGRNEAYDAALLDVAQDHLLWLLAELGHFNDDSLIFKGGTSLRKCRLGHLGRFSTDLDLVAPSEDTVLSVCEAIDGATVGGFTFSLSATRGDGRHWNLHVEHEELGTPSIESSVEFARRPLVLPRFQHCPLLRKARHVQRSLRGTGELPSDVMCTTSQSLLIGPSMSRSFVGCGYSKYGETLSTMDAALGPYGRKTSCQ